MTTVERQSIERTIPLDLSHFPRSIFEEDSTIVVPALTGSVILGVIRENGLMREPLEGFEDGWVQYMPRPLLDSMTDAEPARILEQSRLRLDDYDLGIHEEYREQVAATLDLHLDRRMKEAGRLLVATVEADLSVYIRSQNTPPKIVYLGGDECESEYTLPRTGSARSCKLEE